MPPESKVGILAGGGELPLRIARDCRDRDQSVFAIVFEGQGDPDAFDKLGVEHVVNRLGAAGKSISSLREAGCDTVVLAGTIRRPSVSDLRPDLWAIKFLAKSGAAALGDDGMLRALINAIEGEGFRVVGADEFLPDLLMPLGPIGNVGNENFVEDIQVGMKAARDLGQRDQGQAVVVRDGVVIAEEDARGTDAMLASLADSDNRGGVMCKTLKPEQERRADLPTIGARTVRNAHAAGLQGIAVEAGNTFLMDAVTTRETADELGLFVVGIEPPIS